MGWRCRLSRDVAKSSSSRLAPFWRTDWFAGLLVVLSVFALHKTTSAVDSLERRFYDFASTSSARQPSQQIAVIAIDDQSIADIGRWPWPRDVHARLIDLLSAAKAKTIAYTVFFFEPQVDRGLGFLRRMKDVLASPANVLSVDSSAGQASANAQFAKLIAEAEVALDTDAVLAGSIKNAGNVLLPSFFSLGEPQGKPDKPLPGYALKSALNDSLGYSMPATTTLQPIKSLGSVAAGIGHLNPFQDVDGAVRQEPPLVNYFGKAVPSLALLAAIKSLNLLPSDIQLNAGESLQIGRLRVKTDESARMLAQFYKAQEGKPAFVADSFYDVLNGKIPASKHADKIVIIGATASGVGTLSDTVKVTDFGIARITDSSKTKTGLVLGTPSFMSPEQLAGQEVAGRSDLYSLGAMLFQLLAGVLPFRGESMAELMYKIASDDAIDIRSIRPELPASLASVVALSLNKQPEARYQSGGQFAAELRRALADLPADAGVGVPVHPTLARASANPAHFEKTVFQPKAAPIKPGIGVGSIDIEI